MLVAVLRWSWLLLRFLLRQIVFKVFVPMATPLLTKWTRRHAPENSYIMSPDTVSSLFPDRPIRPLPKRRLRERLSPEVAQSIKYPPSTHDTIPLFYYPPYTLKEERSGSIATESAAPLQHIRRPNLGASFGSLRNGVGPGVLEEEQAPVRSTLVARSPPEIFSRAARNPSRLDQPRPAEPQPPPSSTSSVDGYDSFENTNNKKKRKIPSAGDSAINAAHSLNSEISSIAISTGGHSPTSDVHGASGYVAPGAYVPNSQGFSGPGRGRLGRSRNGRSPLRALPDGNNVWPARSSKAGVSPWTSRTSTPFPFVPPSLSALSRLFPACWLVAAAFSSQLRLELLWKWLSSIPTLRIDKLLL